jgi:ankyrin repeat protein
MSAKSHYQVLSISQDASPEQIRARYAALLQEFRLKLATGNPEDPARLGEIKAAYQVLNNPKARNKYDQALRPSALGAARAPQLRFRRTRAWKLFWLFLVPTVLLALALDTFVGRLLLLMLLIWLPAWLVIGSVVGYALLPLAAAVWLWRCAFNSSSRFWGYANRGVAVLSAVTVSAICYHAVAQLSASALSAGASTKEYANKTPGETLLLAARYGDVKKVRKALAEGVDVHTRETARPNVGRTPLHYAAGGPQYGAGGQHLDVAKVLLAKGADVNAKAEGGYTPLHVASGLGQKEIVQLLLRSGANPNALDTRGTPLHAAVLQGQKDIVLLLLNAGAQVNASDPHGTRPLDVLGSVGSWYPSHDDIAEILVNRGAPVGREHLRNMRSPLAVAIVHDRKRLAMFLADRKAPVDDDVIGLIGSRGQKEVAEHLLVKNLITFDRPDVGQTLLHGAACFSGVEFFDWVLANTTRVDHPAKDGKTALHKAVACGNAAYVEKLIAKGADVHAKDVRGRAPITAFSGSAAAVLRALLNAGANPNDRWEDGSAVLMVAVLRNDPVAVQLLISHGADVNAKTSAGRTALHEAARRNKIEIAEALTSVKGVKLNEVDREGKTPLHVAAEVDAPSVVRLLLQRGADQSIKALDGTTPLALAERRGFKETVEAFK